MVTDLTQLQCEAIQALDWLQDPAADPDQRAVATAIGLVRTAARHPGESICYPDFGTDMAARIKKLVNEFLDTDPRLIPSFRNEVCFRVQLKGPIEEWMPEGIPKRPRRTAWEHLDATE